jgi:hypothetical protein
MSPRRAAWVNLPNFLTLLRLLLVPVVVFYIRDGRYWLAGWLFGAAAFTDILDGAAARWTGANTQVGAYLDPIADKCLLSGVYLALAWAHIVPWWLVALFSGGTFTFWQPSGHSCFSRPAAVSSQHLGQGVDFCADLHGGRLDRPRHFRNSCIG